MARKTVESAKLFFPNNRVFMKNVEKEDKCPHYNEKFFQLLTNIPQSYSRKLYPIKFYRIIESSTIE